MERLEQGEDTPPHLMRHLNQILSRGGGGEVSELTISHISGMAVSHCSTGARCQASHCPAVLARGQPYLSRYLKLKGSNAVNAKLLSSCVCELCVKMYGTLVGV